VERYKGEIWTSDSLSKHSSHSSLSHSNLTMLDLCSSRPSPNLYDQLTVLSRIHTLSCYLTEPSPNCLSLRARLAPSASSLRFLRLQQGTNARLTMDDVAAIVSCRHLSSLDVSGTDLSQSMFDEICKGLAASIESISASESHLLTTLRSVSLCTRLNTLVINRSSGFKGDELQYLTNLEHLVTSSTSTTVCSLIRLLDLAEPVRR